MSARSTAASASALRRVWLMLRAGPRTMTDVTRLLREYIQRQEQGGAPDASDLLEQAEGVDRELLASLIDGYWMTAPPREWDAKAAKGSLSERVAARVAETLEAESLEPAAAWADLRDNAKLTRADVVK